MKKNMFFGLLLAVAVFSIFIGSLPSLMYAAAPNQGCGGLFGTFISQPLLIFFPNNTASYSIWGNTVCGGGKQLSVNTSSKTILSKNARKNDSQVFVYGAILSGVDHESFRSVSLFHTGGTVENVYQYDCEATKSSYNYADQYDTFYKKLSFIEKSTLFFYPSLSTDMFLLSDQGQGPFSDIYTKDKNSVYFIWEKTDVVYPKSFFPLYWSYFGLDEQNVYYKGKILPSIDRNTFRLLQGHTIQDKSGIYEIIPENNPAFGSSGRQESRNNSLSGAIYDVTKNNQHLLIPNIIRIEPITDPSKIQALSENTNCLLSGGIDKR